MPHDHGHDKKIVNELHDCSENHNGQNPEPFTSKKQTAPTSKL
jgi:hypothetical protein